MNDMIQFLNYSCPVTKTIMANLFTRCTLVYSAVMVFFDQETKRHVAITGRMSLIVTVG